MRTVSFSNAKLQDALNNEVVCCYTNTKGDPSAGGSFAHGPEDEPGPCGRGAGRQNVQTIFMTPAGEIFHVATGFLEADDLLEEAGFAKQLFALLQRSERGGKDTVVAAHLQRLKELGFSPQQIASRDHPLGDVLLSGPNPQDFGINVPTPQDFGVNFGGPAGNLFGDIAKRRKLKDHKFAMTYPLITKQEFDRNPQLLVGRHSSFFGSHSALNGIGDMVNERINHKRGRKPQ